MNKGNHPSQAKPITSQDISNAATLNLTDTAEKYLTQGQINYASRIKEHIDLDAAFKLLPQDKEVLFLMSLKKELPQNNKELLNRARNYAIEPQELQSMEQRELISTVSEKQSKFLNVIKRYKQTDDTVNVDEVAKDLGVTGEDIYTLKERGFIDSLSSEESVFLKEVSKLNPQYTDKSTIENLAIEYGVPSHRLSQLQYRGFLSYLNKEELELASFFEKPVSKNAIFEKGNELGIAAGRTFELLEDRFILSDDGSRAFDSSVKISSNIFVSDNIKVNYKEHSPLLVERLNRRGHIPPIYLDYSDAHLLTRFDELKPNSPQEHRAILLKYFQTQDLENFKNRLIKELPQRDIKDLYSLLEGKEDFSERRLQFLSKIKDELQLESSSELRSQVLNNNEYFFLSAVRRQAPKNDKEVFKIAKDYNLTPFMLENLQISDFIDFLSSYDKEYMSNLSKSLKANDEFKLQSLFSSLQFEDLKERGYISELSQKEVNFLEELNGKEITSDGELVQSLKDRFFIDEFRFFEFQNENSHLDILSNDQKNWLEDGAKFEKLKDFNLTTGDYYKLQDRIDYRGPKQVESIDYTSLEANEVKYLDSIAAGTESKALRALAKELGLSKELSFVLRNRIKYHDPKEIISTDLSVRVNTSIILRSKPHVKYRDSEELLSSRPSFENNYDTDLSGKDFSLFLKGTFGEYDTLSFKDKERFWELKSHHITLDNIYIPTNTELAFLEKIQFRKFDEKLFHKIAKEDFSLSEGSVNSLLEQGFIAEKKEKAFSEWQDPKQIKDARIWLSSQERLSEIEHSKIMNTLGIEPPSEEITKLLTKNKSDVIPQAYKEVEARIREHSRYRSYNDTDMKKLLDECLTYVKKERPKVSGKNWRGTPERYLLLDNGKGYRAIHKVLEQVQYQRDELRRSGERELNLAVREGVKFLSENRPKLYQKIKDRAFSELSEKHQGFIKRGKPERTNFIYIDAQSNYQANISRIVEEDFLSRKSFLKESKITYNPQSPENINSLDEVYKPKMDDFKLFFKTIRGEKLSNQESLRLNALRREGVHPESEEITSFLKKPQKQWEMKLKRKTEFLNHYQSKYGINIQALEFVNTWKQVTREQLNYIGLSNEDIDRHSQGLDEQDPILGSPKLLKRNHQPLSEQDSLNQTEPQEYFTIQHSGVVSGRGFLERRIGKELVQEGSQSRQNLLTHDLRVPTSVFRATEELKEMGIKVKKVIPEFSQFAESKKGISNDQRQNGPAYMDATLICEVIEYDEQGIATGKKEIKVGVEYGDYSNGRMEKKLDNADFDLAFVYSSEGPNKRYIQKFEQKTNVHFRIF